MRKIKELRKELGIKQVYFADKLEIQRAYYANVENGRLIPKNIEEIKREASKILFQLLSKKIEETEIDLNYFKSLKTYLPSI
jgi:transcriptional regulator with XRE-family HTH domain